MRREVDTAWRLEDDEEHSLVNVLIACLQKKHLPMRPLKNRYTLLEVFMNTTCSPSIGTRRGILILYMSTLLHFDQGPPTALHKAPSNGHILHD